MATCCVCCSAGTTDGTAPPVNARTASNTCTHTCVGPQRSPPPLSACCSPLPDACFDITELAPLPPLLSATCWISVPRKCSEARSSRLRPSQPA
eukprot:51640-Pelagomonas_calceolata.AAC.7